jgi:diacylglycerol kinase family enzyme
VNQAPKALGGRVSFLVGTLRSIVSYRAAAHPVELRLDGEVIHRGPLVLAAAANGRYFGGGMHVAPQARPDDGLLDVVVVPGFGKARLLAELPRIYRGTHLGVGGVIARRGRVLEATQTGGEPPWVEIDGEPLGRLPARFEVLPGALTLVGAAG